VDVIEGEGRRTPLLPTPGVYQHVRFSPDGRQLALTMSRPGAVSGGNNVWVYDPQRGSMTQLSFDGGEEPNWVPPDGRYLVFGRLDGIFWIRPGSSGQPQRLLTAPAIMAWSFASDGKRLAYYPRPLGQVGEAEIHLAPRSSRQRSPRTGAC
jgi:Tol biopolymer transport system component